MANGWVWLLVGTFVPNRRKTGKPFHNVAALLHRGGVRVRAKKTLLPTYDVFDEGRHFEPGSACTVVPFGGERLGLSICEDLWNDKDFWRTRRLYREEPGEEMVRRGATAIVNISASPFSEGKPRLRRRMLARLARDGRVPVAYVNLVGGNDELVFDGGSMVLDGAGRVRARAALFEEEFVAGHIKGDGPDQARVRMFLEDGTLYLLEGSLRFSDVTVDPSTGSFILRMVFPNPRHTLLPGMYVRPVIQEGVLERAILVPQQGVSRDPRGNPVALIVDGSNKVEQRMITVERAIGDKWLVSTGLKAGVQVIVEGSQRVRPGASVKVVPFDAGRKDGPEAAKRAQPAAKAN